MTMTNISPENIALAIRGSVSAITAGTVTDETHTAYTGGLVQFKFIPDREQTITIKNSAR